jgi:hypothetical protein
MKKIAEQVDVKPIVRSLNPIEQAKICQTQIGSFLAGLEGQYDPEVLAEAVAWHGSALKSAAERTKTAERKAAQLAGLTDHERWRLAQPLRESGFKYDFSEVFCELSTPPAK